MQSFSIDEIKFLFYGKTREKFSFFFFYVDRFLKSLLNLLQYCFCFLCFGFLVIEACGVLVPPPGIRPTSPAFGRQSLTTGPPEKSQQDKI